MIGLHNIYNKYNFIPFYYFAGVTFVLKNLPFDKIVCYIVSIYGQKSLSLAYLPRQNSY